MRRKNVEEQVTCAKEILEETKKSLQDCMVRVMKIDIEGAT